MSKPKLRFIDYEAQTVRTLATCKRCGALAPDAFWDRPTFCDNIENRHKLKFRFCKCGKLADIEVEEEPAGKVLRAKKATSSSLKEVTQVSAKKRKIQEPVVKVIEKKVEAKSQKKKKEMVRRAAAPTAKKTKTSATDKSKVQTTKSAGKGAPQSHKAKLIYGK